MDLGMFCMPMHPPDADPAQWLEADAEMIVTAERLGYAEAWVGEHYTQMWEALPSPDLFIANVLARTSTIRLGTGVSSLPYHHPVQLAHRIALVDQMARGRFMWGIGSGAAAGDFALFDIDAANLENRSLSRDVLDVVLRLWDDPEPGLYEHERWKFTVPPTDKEHGIGLHMKPYQRPHPPIATAGIGPKSDMLTLAGQNNWIPMSIMFVTIPVLIQQWKTYEDAALANGHTPDRGKWRISREIYVGETPEQARKDVVEGTLGRDYDRFHIPHIAHSNLLFALKKDKNDPDEAVTPAYLAEHNWIVGDVDEVTDKVFDLYQQVGGFGTLLAMHHEWDPYDKWSRSMELLAKEVLPRVEAKIAETGAVLTS